MPTWRRFAKMPFQCYRYEAQDVLCELDDVELIEITPRAGFRLTERCLRRFLWKDVSRQLAYVNPGLKPVRVTREYDIFVAVCENWWDLLYINALQGWKDNCRTSVLWLDELFAGMIDRYRYWLPSLLRFDHIVLGHESSAREVGKNLGRNCHVVPAAVDVCRFSPAFTPADRVIDVFSVGRRLERVHEALRDMSSRGRVFYIYDTLVGTSMQVADHRQHREMLSNMLRRTRLSMVAPGMLGEPESGGEPIVGLRFFEGTAAGAVLIGEAPACDAFRRSFDWDDAVIDIRPDGSDTASVVSALLADRDRIVEISRRNAAQAARRHDWVHRWKRIYEIAGVAPTPAMEIRERRLNDAAQFLERGT